MCTIEHITTISRWYPAICVCQREHVERHRVNNGHSGTIIEQRFHRLAEYQRLICLDCLRVNGFDLLARSIPKEFPSVAQLQIIVLVGVCQLVVTDIRVLPSRDTEFSRNLELEITDLRNKLNIGNHRVCQNPNETLLMFVVNCVGINKFAPQLIQIDTIWGMGEDITFNQSAGMINRRCHFSPFRVLLRSVGLRIEIDLKTIWLDSHSDVIRPNPARG